MCFALTHSGLESRKENGKAESQNQICKLHLSDKAHSISSGSSLLLFQYYAVLLHWLFSVNLRQKGFRKLYVIQTYSHTRHVLELHVVGGRGSEKIGRFPLPKIPHSVCTFASAGIWGSEVLQRAKGSRTFPYEQGWA